MHRIPSVLLITALAACGDSHKVSPDAAPDGAPDGTPDGDTTATSIAITSDAPLLLAAFREGSNGPWRAATMISPTSYTIGVHGPYVLAVVYDTGDASFHSYTFDQYAQTLDDDHAISIVTTYVAPTDSAVTGTVVQPGRVYAGDDGGSSTTTPNWTLDMHVSPGPHDLFGFSATHVFHTHALDATHDVALGTLDIDAQGVALNTVAFSAANKTAAEVLTSRAAVESPTTYFAAVARLGDPTQVKVVPDAQLAATEVQSVSVFATDGGHERTRRQPYHAGGATAFTLPTLLGGVSWTQGPDLTVHWTSLADGVTTLDAYVYAEGTAFGYEDVYATPAFLAATHVQQFVFDTSIPGFQAAWKIDTTQQYKRQLLTQDYPAANTVDSETWSEDLNAPPGLTVRPTTRPSGSRSPMPRRQPR